MKMLVILFLALAGLVCGQKGPLQQVEDVEGLPRVLLIGDSISMGYTLPVRELLKGKANVHRPPAARNLLLTGSPRRTDLDGVHGGERGLSGSQQLCNSFVY